MLQHTLVLKVSACKAQPNVDRCLFHRSVVVGRAQLCEPHSRPRSATDYIIAEETGTSHAASHRANCKHGVQQARGWRLLHLRSHACEDVLHLAVRQRREGAGARGDEDLRPGEDCLSSMQSGHKV